MIIGAYGLFLSVLVAFAAGGCKSPIIRDNTVSAAISNDTTLIIEGCGKQPIVGYTYCRVTPVNKTRDMLLTFYVPKMDCDKNSCVSIKIFGVDGNTTHGFEIPKGEISGTVSWFTILGKEEFTSGDRGFYPVLAIMRYKDGSQEKKTIIEGEIRLRVLNEKYISLVNVEDDHSFNWKCSFSYTTSGRSNVKCNR